MTRSVRRAEAPRQGDDAAANAVSSPEAPVADSSGARCSKSSDSSRRLSRSNNRRCRRHRRCCCSTSDDDVVPVRLPGQVRRVQDHADGAVDVDVRRVDPLLGATGGGADFALQVGVEDVSRRERDAAAVDGAHDDAVSFKVLDVAEASQVPSLVVAEAVEAVDRVAVLEDGDPPAVELLA